MGHPAVMIQGGASGAKAPLFASVFGSTEAVTHKERGAKAKAKAAALKRGATIQPCFR